MPVSATLIATLAVCLLPTPPPAETTAPAARPTVGQPAEEPTARFLVHLSAEPPWLAAALEQNILHDLAGFSRVVPIDRRDIDTGDCGAGDGGCLRTAYAAAGIDIIMLGQVDAGELHWAVYDTWISSRVSHGVWQIRGATPAELRQHVLGALRPFMESGGLIDKKPFLTRRDEPPSSSVDASPEGWVLLAAALILLLAVPIALGRGARGRTGKRRIGASRLWATFGILVLLELVALHLWQPAAIPVALARLVAFSPVALPQLLATLGGLAWGWLALLVLRWGLPSVPGIGQIRHRNLWPLLSTWSSVVTLRLLASLFLVVAPAAALTWVGQRLLATEPFHTWVLMAPCSGLLVCFLLLCAVDQTALFLDDCLVIGRADRDNPWHAVIRRYLSGYLWRLGLDIDGRVLDRTLFLPGRGDGIALYGGGLSHPRVVVDIEILELALGPLQEASDEQGAPLAAPTPDAWSLGFVLPHDEEAEPLRRGWERRAERLRAQSGSPPPSTTRRRRRVRPGLIGENVTLLGAIVPLAANETVPLIANDQQDFGVVRQLLTEHYASFAKGWFELDYDDSDPTWKDFLFGALLRELGAVIRSEGLLSTLALSWRTGHPHLPAWVRQPGAFLVDLGQRWLSRAPAALADAYAALNQGRYHLVQALWYEMRGDAAELTAHADAPRLLRTSHQILKQVAACPPTGDDRHRLRATARNRLIWLSRYFHTPLFEQRQSRLGLALAALLLGGAAAAVALAVEDARAFHPIFVERQAQRGPHDGQH